MRCDVAVVGGGPSGSVAAAALARSGARVALIDPSHPREKPCGGGLTGRALELAGHFAAVRSFPGVRVRTARFVDTPRRREARIDLTDADNTLVVASRRDVDAALFDAAREAGAAIVRARVTHIEGGRLNTVGLSDGQRIAAPMLLGADGVNSLVRRTMARPFRRDQLSIATGFYALGTTSDEIVLEMVDDPPGYIWSFPRPDHLAIGICAQADGTTVRVLRSVVRSWIEASSIADSGRLESYSWPIPTLNAEDFLEMPLGGEGWLTVGDAAGLVDPITREGIYFALQSGIFAAEALSADSSLATLQYQDRVREEIGAELATAARLKAGFFRPRFTRLMLDGLAASPRIRAVLADLVAGTQPYRTLKRRLVGTLEIGLAWRWLRGAHGAA